jgi:hypothetical protein
MIRSFLVIGGLDPSSSFLPPGKKIQIPKLYNESVVAVQASYSLSIICW